MIKLTIRVIVILNTLFVVGQNLSQNTTGSFIYIPNSPLNSQPVEVFYHIPTGDISTMPILFSFHGANRNAYDYRDYWIDMANDNGFMVFAPEFSETNYPGGDAFQLGNIFEDGDNPTPSTLNPTNEWTISIIDPLFDFIKTDISGTQEKYNAWGHSGGAQFLHRFVMYLPNSNLDIAVCSNAGWYTVPEFGVPFPYGLQSGELSNSTLINAFSKKLIVHLGQNDTDPSSAGLRHNSLLDNQQGLFRLERGQYFYNTSLSTAQSLSATCNWENQEVPNVAHNAQLMANDALQYVLMSTLSNDDSEMNAKIKIYPNPASSGYVNIVSQNNSENPLRIVLFDITGKEVVRKKISNDILDVSYLEKGIYFLKIEGFQHFYNKKLIID